VRHAGASVLIYDFEFEALAFELVDLDCRDMRAIRCGDSASELETLVHEATALGFPPDDELGLIALNYTIGTTGAPLGVMYSHRGAYLQALGWHFTPG
jgi:fatty-acyl-CoA synthase